ncbi:quinolinate synthase NadA [bacterium]|nr:quinolinate synthase NadA [bacterium]MBP9810239.1 quinolinate synthase NadA [bacterium]
MNTTASLTAYEIDSHTQKLIDEIKQLSKKRNAVILAHNYQIPIIQDVADFVGDSLGLSQQAAKTDAETIVFCGVHFMAETAAILCPTKRVLIPDLEAGCSLAASIDLAGLVAWKAEHPHAVVVSYVNTTAEIKALSDYCCTSGNALKIVQSIPEDKEILFLPDQFLGSWVQKMTGRKNMHIWMGECHVHAAVHPSKIDEKMKEHPDAELLIHPECGCLTPYLDRVARNALDSKDVAGKDGATVNSAGQDVLKVASTEGMLKLAHSSPTKKFVVATEIGILHRLKKENPDKEFLPISSEMSCQFMKMITLEKLHRSLVEDVFHVTVPEETASKARLAIERMIAIF